uniref:Uncharacterized protein n=1 Tax=Zea mays TaxID=4577 RepID=A0A804QBU8_MAIZE
MGLRLRLWRSRDLPHRRRAPRRRASPFRVHLICSLTPTLPRSSFSPPPSSRGPPQGRNYRARRVAAAGAGVARPWATSRHTTTSGARFGDAQLDLSYRILLSKLVACVQVGEFRILDPNRTWRTSMFVWTTLLSTLDSVA